MKWKKKSKLIYASRIEDLTKAQDLTKIILCLKFMNQKKP